MVFGCFTINSSDFHAGIADAKGEVESQVHWSPKALLVSKAEAISGAFLIHNDECQLKAKKKFKK
jgi:hypothetical protein